MWKDYTNGTQKMSPTSSTMSKDTIAVREAIIAVREAITALKQSAIADGGEIYLDSSQTVILLRLLEIVADVIEQQDTVIKQIKLWTNGIVAKSLINQKDIRALVECLDGIIFTMMKIEHKDLYEKIISKPKDEGYQAFIGIHDDG